MKNEKYPDYRLYVSKKFIEAYNEAVTADRKFEDTVKWCHTAHQEWPKSLKGEMLTHSLEWANTRFMHALNEAHRTKRDLMKIIQDGLKKFGLIETEGGAE